MPQAVCGLVGAVLLRRKLTEVQEQLQIPVMNITAVEYELHDVPAAVNGLMVATARKVKGLACMCRIKSMALLLLRTLAAFGCLADWVRLRNTVLPGSVAGQW